MPDAPDGGSPDGTGAEGSWGDATGSGAAGTPDARPGEPTSRCESCRELYPHSALDQRLWCPPCREKLERMARLGSHVSAVLVTVPFGVWVLLESSTEVLSPWAWVLPLGAAYYLGYRIGREVVKGWVRLRSRHTGRG